jgi:predicted HicB family RNase H-like nuclease
MNRDGQGAISNNLKLMYSGHFMVRVTPVLHRQLAIEAAESGVSVNRLANDKLSRVRRKIRKTI